MKPKPNAQSEADPAGEMVTKAEYEKLAGFRYRLRVFLHFSEEAARAVGLTAQQHQALLAVMGYPGRDEVNIGELAERLQIAHHSAVGLVDRLVAQKLLLRKTGHEDARQVYLQVSARGRKLLDLLVAAHKEELKKLGVPI